MKPKKKKAWHSNLPWSRYNEVLDEQNRAREKAELNVDGDSVNISFLAIRRLLKKWRSWRK